MARILRSKWLAPAAVVLLILAVVAVRWATRHPVLAGAVVLAVLAAAAVIAGPPLRRQRAAAAESRRRTEAAMRTAGARDATFAEVVAMTGPQFERHVARLLERDGCEDVRVSGGAGDRGADITAIDPRGWRVVVQCKRYAPTRAVSDPDMQRFVGTVYDEHRADTALFVTTSRFTRAARELALKRRVVLVDGARLTTWMHDGRSPLPEDPLEDAV